MGIYEEGWGGDGSVWRSPQRSRMRRGEERSGVEVSGRVSGGHSGAKNSLGQCVYVYVIVYTRIYGQLYTYQLNWARSSWCRRKLIPCGAKNVANYIIFCERLSVENLLSD